MCDICALTLKIQESSYSDKDFLLTVPFFKDCLWISFREHFVVVVVVITIRHQSYDDKFAIIYNIILWNSGKIIFKINFLKRPPYLVKCEFDWESLVVLKPDPVLYNT